MAYPAKEEFALSSLGYLWLYKIADTQSGINAKYRVRFFLRNDLTNRIIAPTVPVSHRITNNGRNISVERESKSSIATLHKR